MALQLIIGRAGSGKSYCLFEEMIEQSKQNKDKNYIAVVPEQYSMETQKLIMDRHEKHGSFNIEVTSFIRLAYTVFEEIGYSDFQVMDDLGKTLVMRKVLEDCKDQLALYADKTSKPGFTEKMKTVISELKQYNIDNNSLNQMLDEVEERPVLKHKIKDIGIINDAFNSYISENMITSEDILQILCKNIPQSDWIKNTSFYFDGYTGFTPVQYKVLELLMIYAKDVSFAITLPEDELENLEYDSFELFGLSKETIVNLKLLAQENNIKEKPIVIVGKGKEPYRIAHNKSLCHIEKNIFRNAQEKINDENNAIEIHSVLNPHKEAEFVAKKIAKLVVNEGMRYKDIAVVTADMNSYYRFLEEEFNKYNIPAFIDHKRDMLSNPYVDGIIGVLEIIEKDFSYDSVFRFLKLGITNIESDYIDILENYVVRTGRKGYKSYCQKWEKLFRNMPEEHLNIINEAKDILMSIVEPLRNKINGKGVTVGACTRAVYEFLLSVDAEKQLEEYSQLFESVNEKDKAKEYQQSYESIIKLLEQLVSLMDNQVVSVKNYRQIIQAGFENIKVGIIPPGLDMVMVGDLERTRLKDTKKVLFFVGVNDGAIPKGSSGSGVISDLDREFLEKKNFVLAPTAKENLFKQKFYLYMLMSKPTKKIILSFSNTGNDGTVLRKSYLINDILGLFNDVKIKDEELNVINSEDILNKEVAATYVSSEFGNYRRGNSNNLFEQLNHVLLNDDNYKEIMDLITEGAYFKAPTPTLDKINAIRLYGHGDNIKTTALEKYAKCPFSQFLANGLRLKERPEHKIEDFDIGNLFHNALDSFFNQIKIKQIDWNSISKEQSHKILDDCIEKVMEEYENDALESNARNLFLKKQVKSTAQKSIDVLIKHIQNGKFEPAEYELTLKCGRVDRVDIAEEDNKIYVKVIDYKSGNKTFDFVDAYLGIDLQLMLYLKETMEYEQRKNPDKEILPAGAFYFNIKNPYVSKPDFQEETAKYLLRNPDTNLTHSQIKQLILEEAKENEYRMSGLVEKDATLIGLIDKNFSQEEKGSKIVNVNKTTTGAIRQNKNLISKGLYEKYIDHVGKVADKMRQEIMDGNIDIKPIENYCQWCSYKNICGFDKQLGYKCKDKETIKIADIEQELSGV